MPALIAGTRRNSAHSAPELFSWSVRATTSNTCIRITLLPTAATGGVVVRRLDQGTYATVNILGINCFSHDTAAALIQEGRPSAFIEEERFNREKHTKAFPDKAVEFCLKAGGIGIQDVDVVAFAHRAGVDYRRGAADALRR